MTYHKLPGKETASVDGQRLEYVKAGVGDPAIVFLSGAGMDLDSWSRVYPTAATISSAVVYNRLGTGRSDRATAPQSGAVIMETLRHLLTEIGLQPPYLLVGHSLGGLYASLFARTLDGEAAGVVLVDASDPGEIAWHRGQRRPVWVRALGAVLEALDSVFRRNPFRETDFVDETVSQLEAAGPFPAIPLVVVSGGRRMPLVPEAAFQTHLESQMRLVAMSPGGRQVVATRSGHFPQVSEPEVVIDAIRDVIDSLRTVAHSAAIPDSSR